MANNPDSRRNRQSIGVLIAFVIIVIFFFGLYNSASTIPPAPVSSPPSPTVENKPISTSRPSIDPTDNSDSSYTGLVKDRTVQTYVPPPAGYVKKDITEEVQTALPEELRYLVTKAEETEPGRAVVNTLIVDPRGKNGSPQAVQAIRI